MGLIFKPWLAWLSFLSFGLLYLLATMPVSSALIRPLEKLPALSLPLDKAKENTAIVVLGGGAPRYSPEMPGYRPSVYTLERLRYAGWLQKQTKLSLLVTGGGSRPEAESMAQSLRTDFGAEVHWLEDQSLTTHENALFSRELLPETIQTVVLVTHAWHMPRSVLSFKQAGFEVIPAPTAFHSDRIYWKRLRYWLPEVRHLQLSERAIREYIGYLWYKLTYFNQSL